MDRIESRRIPEGTRLAYRSRGRRYLGRVLGNQGRQLQVQPIGTEAGSWAALEVIGASQIDRPRCPALGRATDGVAQVAAFLYAEAAEARRAGGELVDEVRVNDGMALQLRLHPGWIGQALYLLHDPEGASTAAT